MSDRKQVLLRITTELYRLDRLYLARATIDALLDNVFLETFESYLDKDDADE